MPKVNDSPTHIKINVQDVGLRMSRALVPHPAVDHAKLFRSILDTVVVDFTVIFQKILLRKRSFLVADATIRADGHWISCGRKRNYSQINARGNLCASTTKFSQSLQKKCSPRCIIRARRAMAPPCSSQCIKNTWATPLTASIGSDQATE